MNLKSIAIFCHVLSCFHKNIYIFISSTTLGDLAGNLNASLGVGIALRLLQTLIICL